MKIAIISDIHGNSWALEAMLADVKQKRVTEIIDLGDSLYGPLDPMGTYKLIKKWGITSLKGNQDREILENTGKKIENHTLNYVLNELSKEVFTWLTTLPVTRVIHDNILAFHGTLGNDTEYFIEELHPDYVGIKSSSEINSILQNTSESIILCGHSHTPRVIETGEKLIINPGSVGLQAYDDDLPIFHKMQNHTPMARYCILNMEGKPRVEQIAIPYNNEKAASRAEQNNRPDWANWLRTGIA